MPRLSDISRFLGVFLLFSLLAGCIFDKEDVKEVEAAVATFHRDLNSGRYAAIYRKASAQLRASQSEFESRTYFASLHHAMGRRRSFERDTVKETRTPEGIYYVVVYRSRFDKGEASETFNFLRRGRLELVGYALDSAPAPSASDPSPSAQGQWRAPIRNRMVS